jgi:hypothetical protein
METEDGDRQWETKNGRLRIEAVNEAVSRRLRMGYRGWETEDGRPMGD